MGKTALITTIFVIAIICVLIGYDIWASANITTTSNYTITFLIRNISKSYPISVFSIGVWFGYWLKEAQDYKNGGKQ